MGRGEGKSDSLDLKPPENPEKVNLDPEEDEDRETWSNQCEFFLSCLGYAVGFGNVWRFPFLCYKNGGAVFLIPYVIMLFCAGLPLFFMELALGQFVSLGPNILFPKLAKIFSGVGWAMLVVSGLVTIYYNMILAWTLFYTFASFTSNLPWSHCNNDFNSIGCFTSENSKACEANGTVYYDNNCTSTEYVCGLFNLTEYNTTYCEDASQENETIFKIDDIADRISASEDYFKNRMLGVTGTSWENMGSLRWELVGCLGLAWIIVCLCMIKGVKSSGKVVYFTALFPYAVLVILFIRGITLDGAYDGINFYIMQPNLTKLYEAEVWNDAATQIFYSLGSSFGGLITLASYNKFTNNCMRDAIVIAMSNCSTSVFSGFVIFSILGFMAKEIGKPISQVVKAGSGLAFVAYPEAVTKMPLSPLWSILFFTMLITLGLDSQFTMVETLTTGILDRFVSLRPKKSFIVIGISVVLFLCGLTMCLEGGIYMFELFNGYSAGLSIILLALFEIISVQYVYGFKNFMKNITEGIGIHIPKPLYIYWASTWLFITPVALIIIFFFAVSFWKPISFGDYVFPQEVQGLGWLITASSVILIPIFAIYQYYQNRTRNQSFKELFATSEDFCPRSERRLKKLKGAGQKGADQGIYRYAVDNEGFSEGVSKVYPNLDGKSFDNNAFNKTGMDVEMQTNGSEPPSYVSSHM